MWLMRPTAQDDSYRWQGSCNNFQLQDTVRHQIMMMLYILMSFWIVGYPYDTSKGRYLPSAELVAGATT